MRPKLRTGCVSVILSILAVGALGVGTAGAKLAPVVMPRPDTKLVGGETIHLQGVNWPADDTTLVAWECDSAAHPVNPAFCDSAGAVPVSSNSKGKLTHSTFTMTTGVVGGGSCGTSSADKTCYLAVYDTSDTAVHAVAKILFKVPTGGS
jgi:hypothetical protein